MVCPLFKWTASAYNLSLKIYITPSLPYGKLEEMYNHTSQQAFPLPRHTLLFLQDNNFRKTLRRVYAIVIVLYALNLPVYVSKFEGWTFRPAPIWKILDPMVLYIFKPVKDEITIPLPNMIPFPLTKILKALLQKELPSTWIWKFRRTYDFQVLWTS